MLRLRWVLLRTSDRCLRDLLAFGQRYNLGQLVSPLRFRSPWETLRPSWPAPSPSSAASTTPSPFRSSAWLSALADDKRWSGMRFGSPFTISKSPDASFSAPCITSPSRYSQCARIPGSLARAIRRFRPGPISAPDGLVPTTLPLFSVLVPTCLRKFSWFGKLSHFSMTLVLRCCMAYDREHSFLPGIVCDRHSGFGAFCDRRCLEDGRAKAGDMPDRLPLYGLLPDV